MLPPPLPQPLEPARVCCAQCGTIAEGTANNWRAFIGGGFEGEPLELIAFCPGCAQRELGLAA